jgi:hypothetical protein
MIYMDINNNTNSISNNGPKENLNTLPISTLNTSKRETANSAKRFKDVWTLNLHVKHNRKQLENMVVPRGITMIIHPYNINEQQQVEGTLITLTGTRKNPNVLCQREYNELQEFANQRLKVLTDAPYELSQHKEQIKLETKIFNENIANQAFNIQEMNGVTYGEI